MPPTRIPSPARSQGPPITPRRSKHRRTRSIGSPARSNASLRLSSVIDQFKENNRHSTSLLGKSVLPDTTDIDMPRRKSWYKKVEHSRDVLEVLDNTQPTTANNPMEELEVEVLSQEKKNYTIDMLESSGSESICSIVMPQRRLFTQQDVQPQKKFEDIVGNRDTLSKQNKTGIADIPANVGKKALFGHGPKRTKPDFPIAALVMSPDKTANKTTETTAEGKQNKTRIADIPANVGKKALFGHGPKRTKPDFPLAALVMSPDKTVNKTIETTAEGKQNKTHIADIHANVGKKSLFGHGPKRAKPDFPIAALVMSPDKTANKTTDTAAEIQAPPRKLFGNRPANEMKNIFAACIATDSEDDISDIQPNVFAFQNNKNPVRHTRSMSHGARSSPTSSITTDIEMDDWQLLPSSTMLGDQIEKATPGKRPRLSKLSEVKESMTNSTGNKSKQLRTSKNKSKTSPVHIDINEDILLATEQREPSPKNISAVKNRSINKSKLNKSKNKNASVKEISQNVTVNKDLNLVNTNKVVDESPENLQDIEVQNESELVNQEEKIEATGNKNEAEANENIQIKIRIENVEVQNEEEHVILENELDHHSLLTRPVDNKDVQQAERESENVEQGKSDNEAEDKQYADLVEERGEEVEKDQNVSQIEGSDVENEKEQNENEVEESGEEDEEEQNETEVEENDKEDVEEQNESVVEESDKEDVEEQNENQVEESGEEDEEEQNESKVIESDQEDEGEQNESQVEENCENEEEQNDSQVEESGEEDEKEQNESQVVESDKENEEDQNDSQVEESGEEDEEEQNESQVIDSDEDEEEQNESQVEERSEEDEEEQNESQVVESDKENEVEQNESEVEENGEEDEEVQNESEVEESGQEDGEEQTKHAQNKENLNDKEFDNILRQKEPNDIVTSPILNASDTSVGKTKSIIKNFHVKQSLALSADSTCFGDGTENSSAGGSGWDSHRTTRKTLRQTYGNDFTPRKSLRTLVMEKTAKRQTIVNEANAKLYRANSTAKLDENEHMEVEHNNDDDEHNYDDQIDDEESREESVPEVSPRSQQVALEKALQKVKQAAIAKKLATMERIQNLYFKPRPKMNFEPINPFRRPIAKPLKPRPMVSKSKGKKALVAIENLPPELVKDMNYKPPKRFKPANASWITKRLYKFLERKLEPRYDYQARVRAEALVQLIYNFVQDTRRDRVAPPHRISELKRELARLDIVTTHHDFYNFFHDYMPLEVCYKVIPDIINDIPLPKDVFSAIIVA